MSGCLRPRWAIRTICTRCRSLGLAVVRRMSSSRPTSASGKAIRITGRSSAGVGTYRGHNRHHQPDRESEAAAGQDLAVGALSQAGQGDDVDGVADYLHTAVAHQELAEPCVVAAEGLAGGNR